MVLLAVNWITRGLVVPGGSTAPTAARAASSSNLSTAQSAWAVRVSKAIKAAAHDPASIEWIYAGVTNGGEVGCVEYRAKNRMGALVLERLVVNAGKFERAPAAVNYGCGAEAKSAMRDVVGVFRYYP